MTMDAEARLTRAYFKAHPLEATRQLESWSATDVAGILSPYVPEDIAAVLEHLSPLHAARILALLSPETTADVATLLPTASAVRVLRQCAPSVQEDILARLDQSIGPALRLRMTYPNGTAASLADPRVTTLPPDILAGDALERIRRDIAHATYYHYVVERDGLLVGLVTTKTLLGAFPGQAIAAIMKEQIVSVAAESTEDELRQTPHWRLYHTLPVVDHQHRFIGALHYRTLRRLEAQSEPAPTAGPLPHALLQMWEAYALIGLHIMTDLTQAVETSVSGESGRTTQEDEATDVTSSDTP